MSLPRISRRLCLSAGLFLLLAHSALASDRFNPLVMNTTSQQRYNQAMAAYPNVRDLSMRPGFSTIMNEVATSPDTRRQFIQDAIDECAGTNYRLFIPKGNYKVGAPVDTPTAINIPDNCCIEWENGAWILPQVASPGSWFTNGRTWNSTLNRKSKQRTNVVLINPQIDGAAIDYNASGYKGDNAMGFAGGYDQLFGGAEDPDHHFGAVGGVYIFGGHFRNFMANNVTGGPGGKGINFEEGVSNSKVDSLAISNCTYACFTSPTTSDPNKCTAEIVFANISVDHCGAMFYYVGDNDTDTVAMAPPSGTALSHVVFDGSGSNVGHYPDRISENNHEKTAPIVISAGANVYVTATIYNPPGFPDVHLPGGPDTFGGGTRFSGTYPNMTNPAEKGRIGAGLSGPIGAVVWGWGVNCTAKVQYTGDCDDVIRIQRPRAMGIDKYPSHSSNTKPYGAFNFNVYVWASGTASTPLRYGQRGLVGFIESTSDVGLKSAVLPAPASLRDDEYVGIPMALYISGTADYVSGTTPNYVTRTVTDYQPFYPGGTGNKHDAFVESNWGINEYPHMYFKLGSTHAAASDQVSGIMWVCSGIPDSNGNLVGHLTLNANLTNDAQANIYPTYGGVGMCYPTP